MAYIDDRIWCHPKFAGISARAFQAYIYALGYSSGFSLKGRLNDAQLKTIGAEKRARNELVERGLWHSYDGGIAIHDWDDYNSKRDARRAADRTRKKGARAGTTPTRDPDMSAGNVADETADVRTLVRTQSAADTARTNGGHVADETALKGEGSEGSEGSDLLTTDRSVVHTSSANSRTAEDERVQVVYDCWRTERGKTSRRYESISPKRRSRIAARLRDGFTPDELCQAIRAVNRDPWMDRQRHDDIPVILRDREQVERFLEMDDGNRRDLAPAGQSQPHTLRYGRGLTAAAILRQATGTS